MDPLRLGQRVARVARSRLTRLGAFCHGPKGESNVGPPYRSHDPHGGVIDLTTTPQRSH